MNLSSGLTHAESSTISEQTINNSVYTANLGLNWNINKKMNANIKADYSTYDFSSSDNTDPSNVMYNNNKTIFSSVLQSFTYRILDSLTLNQSFDYIAFDDKTSTMKNANILIHLIKFAIASINWNEFMKPLK